MEHCKDALARLIGGRGCIRLCDGQSGSRKNRSTCVRPSLRGLWCGALQIGMLSQQGSPQAELQFKMS
eukprot:scaffold124585_cov66-Cyclotella_meneghiniana.AAC.1